MSIDKNNWCVLLDGKHPEKEKKFIKFYHDLTGYLFSDLDLKIKSPAKSDEVPSEEFGKAIFAKGRGFSV